LDYLAFLDAAVSEMKGFFAGHKTQNKTSRVGPKGSLAGDDWLLLSLAKLHSRAINKFNGTQSPHEC
jgi:hypothetical protein